MTPQEKASGSATCIRCKSAPSTVHFRDTCYCHPCFKGQFEQKSKPGLELARGAGLARYIADSDPSSSQPVTVNAKLALGWSGGMSSRALLTVARQYFRPADQQQGRTQEVEKAYVLFIDDSAVIEGGEDRTQEARSIVESQGSEVFKFIPFKLEDVYLDHQGQSIAWDCSSTQSSTTVEDRRQALRALFSSVHPADTPRTAIASARTRTEDLHRILTQYLLRREASKLGCASLMLGESGTRLSIRLIESLAKGGGHKLAVEGSEAVWMDDLLVVRPLKSHLLQEVQFYAELSGIEWLTDQDLVPSAVPAYTPSGEPVMDKSSIARLTETFILNLEKGVPSTISTIGRTGSKLVLKVDGDKSIASPVVASGFEVVGPSEPLLGKKARKAAAKVNGTPLEPRIGARASRLAHTARNLPHWAATKAASCPLCDMPAQKGAKDWKNNITISVLSDILPVNQTQALTVDAIDLPSLLCYACILTLDTDKPLLLPSYVLRNAQRRITTTPLHGLTAFPSHPAKSNKLPQEALPQIRRVDRQEMKASINEFLLE